jgi:hypothetical protein
MYQSNAPTITVLPEEITAQGLTQSPPNEAAKPGPQGNTGQRWGQYATGTNYSDNTSFRDDLADATRVGATVFSLGTLRLLGGSTARATLPATATAAATRSVGSGGALGARAGWDVLLSESALSQAAAVRRGGSYAKGVSGGKPLVTPHLLDPALSTNTMRAHVFKNSGYRVLVDGDETWMVYKTGEDYLLLGRLNPFGVIP